MSFGPDPDLPERPRRPVRGTWLLIAALLLTLLTAIGLAVLGDRLFEIDFSP